MTKEKFKIAWESPNCNITYDDIAECAKAWGLYATPRIHDIEKVRYRVLKVAGCVDAEEYALSEEDV